MDGYVFAEVHLVAAHPAIQHALFPSKIWKSLASKATNGFLGIQGCDGGRVGRRVSKLLSYSIWTSGVISSKASFTRIGPRYANAL